MSQYLFSSLTLLLFNSYALSKSFRISMYVHSLFLLLNFYQSLLVVILMVCYYLYRRSGSGIVEKEEREE